MSIEKEGKKKWMIAIVAGVVVVGVAIAAIGSNFGKEQAVTIQGTVSMIEKRTIANSISGNGTVEAAAKEYVTGGSLGMEVKTVNVEVGDVVAKGDIICVFDTTDLEDRIEDLQEQITKTEENRVEQNAEYDQQQINAVTSQQTQYANLATELNTAKEELKAAEEELALRQKKYEDSKEAVEKNETDDSTDVKEDINTGLSIADDTNLLNQISEQQRVVDSKKTRVDAIQAQIDILLKQDNYIYVEAKEDNDEQAKETTDFLNDQIHEYQKQINKATIRANMAGVVTSVNVSSGTTFTGGTIASIEVTDDFVIEAQIEEYNIPDIEVGMKVLVKTDATRDEELEGVVTYVAPRATNSGSSSISGISSLISGVDTSSLTGGNSSATYLVKIALNESHERLRLGMNAKVSIITVERIDTWSVPYDAVYTREDGTTYLDKVIGKDENGNILTEEMDVELGVQGTYYVEVLSDEIKEETQILIPDVQGNSSIEELLNMMGADAGI